MSIVLNETEWAEEKIRNNDIGKKPFETLTRVARYYLDKGYKKEDARAAVEKFLLQCDSSYSLQKWSDMIKYAMNKAIKNEAVNIDGITITKKELEIIDSINVPRSSQLKRLMFTLLCLSKFRDICNPLADHWVNTPDNEIMRMANINTSIVRQSQMYHTLNELGYIQFSKKVDNTNVRVLFSDDSDKEMFVSDFRNLGNQYMMRSSSQYIKCANCGTVVRRSNIVDVAYNVDYKRQKYCKQCAAEMKMRRNIERTMTLKLKTELSSGTASEK